MNVDELIEQANRYNVKWSAYPEPAPLRDVRLLKPHGTVSRGKYVFRAEQVVRPLPRAWSERLRADLDGAEVVVIGYAGLDVDLRVPLGDALAHAAKVTWFETDDKRDELLARFPALTSRPFSLAGTSDPNALTGKILEWADHEALTDAIPESVRAIAAGDPEPAIPLLSGSKHLARALVAESCGATKQARHGYRIMILTRPWSRAARTAAGRLARLALYEPTRSARVTPFLSDTRAAKVLPGQLAARLDRAHVTLLSSHEGRHEDAVARAVICPPASDLGL